MSTVSSSSLMSLMTQPYKTKAGAYLFQYVSLMFILLSFTIGAFTHPEVETLPVAEIVEKKVAAIDSKKVPFGEVEAQEQFVSSTLTLSNVFDSRTHQLDTDKVEALVTVLKAHDLTAEIEVAANPDFETALARTMTLNRFFEDQGVSIAVVRVFAVGFSSKEELRVRFENSPGRAL